VFPRWTFCDTKTWSYRKILFWNGNT
jgi:hypothetical protein